MGSRTSKRDDDVEFEVAFIEQLMDAVQNSKLLGIVVDVPEPRLRKEIARKLGEHGYYVYIVNDPNGSGGEVWRVSRCKL